MHKTQERFDIGETTKNISIGPFTFTDHGLIVLLLILEFIFLVLCQTIRNSNSANIRIVGVTLQNKKYFLHIFHITIF